MTEGCEEKDSLVRVRAQVMTRDDSSGGWVPMDGGGLSNVSVRKRLLPALINGNNCEGPGVGVGGGVVVVGAGSRSSTSGPGPPTPTPSVICQCNIQQHEYLILGKRISDQTVVLKCTIRKDFQYNKVMPTFHHWRTGDQKFGLTFQTAADARAFDKGVRMAVEDLLDGLADPPPALRHMNSDASEDDVFMTLELPMERSELQPATPPPSSQTSNRHQQALQPPPVPSARSSPSPPKPASPPPPPPPPPPTSTTITPPPLPKEPHLHRLQFVQRRPLPPSSSTGSLPLLTNAINEGKEHSTITAEQLMWQQRDQELALTRERERANKEKERQRREREGIWSAVGGIGLNDHIELDKESYSYVQFARDGGIGGTGGGVALHSLHSLHEYSYPVMPDPASTKPTHSSTSPALVGSNAMRRDSLSSLKKNVVSVNSCSSTSTTAPMLPSKTGRGVCPGKKSKRRGSNSSSSSTKLSHLSHPSSTSSGKCSSRLRCKHCQDMFRPDENRRGACDYAPDCVRSTIDAVSCVGCAQCLLYHCYADAEGDFAPQPCSCVTSESGVRRHQQLHDHHHQHSSCQSGSSGGGDHHNHHHHHQHDDHDGCCDSPPKRWFGLALLSLVVPCLWCYLPLRACYRCGVKCGCCGQPHEAA